MLCSHIHIATHSCTKITQIAEVERLQQANMVSTHEFNAIQALVSRNFFQPNMIEGGSTGYPLPDKKVLHLGYTNHLFPCLCVHNQCF